MDSIEVAKELADLVGIDLILALDIVDREMDEETRDVIEMLRRDHGLVVRSLKGKRYRDALDQVQNRLKVWATTDLSDRITPQFDGSNIPGNWMIDLGDMADWVLKCRWGFVVVGLLAERKRRSQIFVRA